MRLYNEKEINLLMNAVDECKGDVILRSTDESEEYNLKSKLSQYIAIGELCTAHGEDLELYCMQREDEPVMLRFLDELAEMKKSA